MSASQKNFYKKFWEFLKLCEIDLFCDKNLINEEIKLRFFYLCLKIQLFAIIRQGGFFYET